ncbi:LysR family transcriptional regulator [Shimia thalassica]|uniref:LysR family transcriptional regulator n=1 Tax=Shimia thalassica TaxID=1715693 RepID=UPI0026E2CD6D|nr:LysR family transcriptional regulator [Shimia thalassica]MDO6797776.1 LysR family transcriptional regulator [Shimia thalassica]
MEWRHLPPLSALRAFAAFAEKGSVQSAGVALNVSHAAISQQIRNLETHLGIVLLDRTARSASLTIEGRQLAEALLDGFSTMIQRVEDLTAKEVVRPLHIATTPAFASNWLVPRLPEFREKHPDIDIMIDPNPSLTDPSAGGIDVCIRYGNGRWDGLQSEELLPSSIAVVAAPSLIGDQIITSPADLVHFPWLQEFGTSESTVWLSENGVHDGTVKGGMIHLPGNLMDQAARNGQGVAVTARAWVEDDLKAERLVLLFEGSCEKGYHVVYQPDALRPSARLFRAWLRRLAQKRD